MQIEVDNNGNIFVITGDSLQLWVFYVASQSWIEVQFNYTHWVFEGTDLSLGIWNGNISRDMTL